jgi:Tol biopolymer transport system component
MRGLLGLCGIFLTFVLIASACTPNTPSPNPPSPASPQIENLPTVDVVAATLASTPTPTATLTPIPTEAAEFTEGRIFFVSLTESALYVLEPDALTYLVDIPLDLGYPAISPDGDKLVIGLTTLDPVFESKLYMMTIAIGELWQMTYNPEIWDISPAWSPDGQNVAFVSSRHASWQIYTVNANCVTQSGGCESGLVPLTERAGLKGCLAWSPDGKQIAFFWYSDVHAELYTINLEDRQITPLTDDPSEDTCPSWSPDGQQIAFQSDRDGDMEIYLMDSDGSGVIQITNNQASDEMSTWSPDGKQIAFQSDRDGNHAIFLMNADGSGAVRVTDLALDAIRPVWLPPRN